MPAFIDLKGQRFGRLVAEMSQSVFDGIRQIRWWKCICDCKRSLWIRAGSLTSGKTISCGCSKKDRRIDLLGQRFGRLLVIKTLLKQKGPKLRTFAECQCDCGKVIVTMGQTLRTGQSKSCGCYQRERAREVLAKANITHGGKGTRLYSKWKSMMARCNNPNKPYYPDYGGRGIKVCERWYDFAKFRDDMGEIPFPRATIERVDNSKGYSPDNCKWATYKEQNRNRRSTRMVTFNGETKSLVEWVEKLGLNYKRVQSRITNLGWTFEQAISIPKNHERSNN